jgi:hypothetical protein
MKNEKRSLKENKKRAIAEAHLAGVPPGTPETPAARGFAGCPCPKDCPLHGECLPCVAYHGRKGKRPRCERFGYMLRRLLAERTKSAREAVLPAGELIEKFGYRASDRTYSIVDRNEAGCWPQNCEALVNEFIRFNKSFTMMAYPNRSHGIFEGENTTLHLYGTMPPYWQQNLPPGP